MKIKFLVILLLVSAMAYSQEINVKDVPQSVLESFEKAYTGAKIKKWEKKNDIYYATLISDGQNGVAEFDADGKWKITNFEVNSKELPSTITSYCQSTFPGFKVDKTNYVETEDKTYYFVVVRKEGIAQNAHSDLTFDISGKLTDREDFNLEGTEVTPDRKEDQQHSSSKSGSKQKQESGKQQSNKSQNNRQNTNNKPGLEGSTLHNINVPSAVRAAFTKKFARATELTWDTIHKMNYLAIFKFRNQKQKAEFLPAGKWLSSTTVIDSKSLYAPIARYIQEKYSDHKIKYAETTVNNMRKSSYYIQVYRREKGEILITQLYFDKSGKIDRIIDPDVTDEPLPSTIDENFDKKVDDDISKGKGINDLVDRDLKEKELPTPIIRYIKINYPEYKMKRAAYETESEYGQAYHVFIRREGIVQPNAELYFNINGKLLKKIDENTDELGEEENQELAQGMKAPDPVEKSFRDKYPGSLDISWDKDDNGIYVADFKYKNNKCKGEFKDDGTWMKTTTEMSDKLLPLPVTSYIERTYKGGKIQYAEFVEKIDKKNYYYCEVIDKKKQGEPAKLYFTTAGRLQKKIGPGSEENNKEE